MEDGGGWAVLLQQCHPNLSEAGQRKFGEILNKECEKVMRSDRIGTRESSEVSPVSKSQGIEENENFEYSFWGFTQEN